MTGDVVKEVPIQNPGVMLRYFFNPTLFFLVLHNEKTSSHINTVVLITNVLITFIRKVDKGQ
jgi:hypothetical protein